MTPAENAWRIAMEAAATRTKAEGVAARKYPDEAIAETYCEDAAIGILALPMPPAFRTEVEAEAEELRETLTPLLTEVEEIRNSVFESHTVGFDPATLEPEIRADLARLDAMLDRALALLSSLEAKGESHE